MKCFNLACQRAKRRANFSTWRVNKPKTVPVFQTFLLRNAKGNFYTLLIHKKFSIILDINSPSFSIMLFCSLVRNGNIKRSAMIFIIFSDSLMFYQILLSPQVKRSAFVTYKHGKYELSHELPNDLRLRIIGN